MRASGRPKWEGETDNKAAVGLDAKWGIQPNLYLDVTASPDFSEVESDPFIYQLSPYENYLQENRPFFTEGSRYFSLSSGDEYHDGGTQPLLFAAHPEPEVRGQGLRARRADSASASSAPSTRRSARRGSPSSASSASRRISSRTPRSGSITPASMTGRSRNQNVALDYNFNFKDFYYIRGMGAFTFNEGVSNVAQRHPPASIPEGAGRRPADHVGLPADRGQRRHPDRLYRPGRRPVLRPHDRLCLAL